MFDFPPSFPYFPPPHPTHLQASHQIQTVFPPMFIETLRRMLKGREGRAARLQGGNSSPLVLSLSSGRQIVPFRVGFLPSHVSFSESHCVRVYDRVLFQNYSV